ncbi:MAG: formylglycine-generating enzyme family protein [Myxococcales bacterium]|nr:formylglycine-generating enzyme family protein [Myxococcales bacterium]
MVRLLFGVLLVVAGCEPTPRHETPLRVSSRTAPPTVVIQQPSPGQDAARSALNPPKTPPAVGQRLAPAPAALAEPLTPVQAPPPVLMTTVPAGDYRPFFPGKDEPKRLHVPGFRLDVTPVTVAAYLAFVRAHPSWQRGKVPRLFADASYLRPWRSAMDPGVPGNTVVTHVSWFAARAYCQWRGKRLPESAEWERAAVASSKGPDGRKEDGFNARILRWYSHPTRGRPGPVGRRAANFFGVRDLHGLVWEWVEDFNTALVTGESRADSALERGLYCGAGSIGAADPSDYAAFMRFALRSSLKAVYTTGSLGFRCASDLPSGGKK